MVDIINKLNINELKYRNYIKGGKNAKLLIRHIMSIGMQLTCSHIFQLTKFYKPAG